MLSSEHSKSSVKKCVHKKWMWLFVVTTLLFAGSTGFFIFRLNQINKILNQGENKEDVRDQEKESLIQYLNNIENTYAELIYEYEGLDSLLTVEKAKVNDLKVEIKDLEGSSENYKMKAEEMRYRLEDYQSQIKNLKMRNEELTAENIKVKSELNDIISEKKTLEAKVEKGAVLKAYEILAYGVRVKGSGEELPTQNARLTDKIKTCFILSENTLTSKGNKTIYVRIFGPDGKILTASSDTFSFEGKEISYSMRKQVFYDNAAMDLCLYWEKPMEYIKGDYTVVLFADSQIIGSTYFTLE